MNTAIHMLNSSSATHLRTTAQSYYGGIGHNSCSVMSSSRSGRRVSSRRVAVENRAPLPLLPVPTTNLQRDGVKPLSGKPYYHVVLLESHLGPRYLMGPSTNICLELPSDAVPTVLNYRGKSWDMIYNGLQKTFKKFTSKGWRNFAEDNCLKVGDACIFELMESSKEKIIFEVQILRGDIPSKFLGESAEEPIVIV